MSATTMPTTSSFASVIMPGTLRPPRLPRRERIGHGRRFCGFCWVPHGRADVEPAPALAPERAVLRHPPATVVRAERHGAGGVEQPAAGRAQDLQARPP